MTQEQFATLSCVPWGSIFTLWEKRAEFSFNAFFQAFIIHFHIHNAKQIQRPFLNTSEYVVILMNQTNSYN